ncbi:MAG: aspartate carbamoyltransferase [Clostridiales bacterium]|nr:aspartate carbamoyltransferase [Clostridiales bacterium]
MKYLIDPMDLTTQEVRGILQLAHEIMEDPKKYAHKCEGKKLATLFFEPSTRTRLSFEAAMLELGGSVIGFSSADSSSAAKGENVADTVRVVQCYADIIVMRHPKEGSAKAAAMNLEIPFINAGDGGHQHPTQTLTDLLSIESIKGRLDHLSIGLCGDLMFGRTVHSLIRAMMRYQDIKFTLISPEELHLPNYLLKEMKQNGVPYVETRQLEGAIDNLDILYMTRVQKERFFNEADYLRLRDSCILDSKKLSSARPDMIILHPLPRVNEIPNEIDKDPRACYFKQVLYGKYVRMALILTMLGESEC